MYQTFLKSCLLLSCLGLASSGVVLSISIAALAQQYTPPKPGSFKPTRSTLPARREGAGVRGPCIQGNKALTPITPQANPTLTVSEYPTFFWYVPTTIAQKAELVLLDESEKPVYQTTFKLNRKPGIVNFRIPRGEGQPLGIGQTYHWQFSLVCNPDDPSENPFVEGWIQRVQPQTDLVSELRKTKPIKQPAVYAARGIWDALTVLADLRGQRPGDQSLVNNWQVLLRSVNLGHLAQEPLVNKQ
jgi:hypothetical protein